MAILTWCCCCFKRANDADTDDWSHNIDQDIEDIEEGRRRGERCDNDVDTASTIPSFVNITSGLFWSRRNKRRSSRAAVGVAESKQVSGGPLPPPNGRRFSRNHHSERNGNRQRRRERRRRNRRLPSFGAHQFPSTPGTSPNGNHFFDHATILTSSWDDMSLSDEDRAAAVASVAESARRNNKFRPTEDPPGSRLTGPSLKNAESYPNATIQFRNPINGNGRKWFEDGEVDLLVDFLLHTEDYVRYPRSRLTILLRARAPETNEDREELEHLRAIVEDAASAYSFTSLGISEHSEPQQHQRPPLQVFITTTNSGGASVSSDEDLLRCAPTGGLLVTFGSVWELPEGYPGFLKDLIV